MKATLGGLANQFLDDFAMDISQTIVTSLELEGQLRMIDPKQMQNCGVEVVYMNSFTSDVVAEIIGLPDS